MNDEYSVVMWQGDSRDWWPEKARQNNDLTVTMVVSETHACGIVMT
jgi:hypothetical protein